MGYPLRLRQGRGRGVLQNTYTTAKSVIPADWVLPIGPGFLKVDDELVVRVSGGISNVVTAQPTFTFQMMMGPTSNIIAYTSQACLTTTTAHTLIPFEFEVAMRMNADGAGTSANFISSGKLKGIMFLISGAVADPTLGIGELMCPATAPAAGTGWNNQITNYLDFWVGISASNAGNGIQVEKYSVDLYREDNF